MKVVKCNIKLFTDDTCLYINVDNHNDSPAPLNADLKSIWSWENQWLVKINPSKTQSMTISNRNDPLK